MEFLEKDLEEVIYNADKPFLQERGLEINGKLKRQHRIGNYGVCDLISIGGLYYDGINPFQIEIIELKKEKIGIAAFLQAVKYLKGVKSYISKLGKDPDQYSYSIKLIGRTIDRSGSFLYLTDMLYEYNFKLEYYTYSYKEDGIYFKREHGYKLIEEGF